MNGHPVNIRVHSGEILPTSPDPGGGGPEQLATHPPMESPAGQMTAPALGTRIKRQLSAHPTSLTADD